MTSIFLSYARDDDELFVRRLYDRLKNAKFEVWFDRVSMPSRRLTFYQEIRDAIAGRDRLVLVVGPKAVASDYVKQEWRFAHFEALKCVNPVVRLDGKDAAGKSIDGCALIPEDLRFVHAEDFRRDDEFEHHAENIVRQLSEALPPAGKLVAVPELSPHFVSQPERVKALYDILLADLTKPVVVSGAAGRIGLQGMGGIGKSVLASALAHRPEVCHAFPDGIYWVTLGQEPRIEELQQSLLQALGEESIFTGVEGGKQKLSEALAQRAALLVLDNVWQRPHAEAFNVTGPRCRLLLTTRDAGLVTALASRENHYQVQLPTMAEAEVLLAKAAGTEGPLPPEARAVIERCGNLPLALALCGGMVQPPRGVPWRDMMEALRERDLKYISDRHPLEDQHASIWRAIDASVHVLGSEERERFTELAVFALDTGAPEAAVLTLWEHTAGLRARYARELLGDLAERSLVKRDEADGRIKLHDLIHHFATGMAEKQFGAITPLHQRLLDAYEKKCPSGWPSGPDDGYFLQNLCNHLVASGRTEDAVTLLTGLPWIEAKCRAKLVFSLQDDYAGVMAAMPEAQERLRQEREREVRLDCWTEEITEYSRKWSERRDRTYRGGRVEEAEPALPGNPVACRMWTDEEIETECRRIREAPTRLDRLSSFAAFVHGECYPLVQFGGREGFTLQHAFNYAPGGPVRDAAAGPLARCAAPPLIRHWLEEAIWNPKPAMLRTLEGHKFSVWSVSVTPDGRRAVSGSLDHTLRVWDLESGACLRTLEHSGPVRVSVTPDGRRAVSGSGDKTLRVWDLESGACLRTLEGHSNGVWSVSVTPDGRRAVSGSEDNTLRVWDLESGACLRTLEGHNAVVFTVSVTPDGRRGVSGSKDKTLRVWDLESGACLRTLEGHSDVVASVSVTPDGRRAVSGSEDKTLRVWDLESGACLRTLEGHRHRVESVSVTPDGRRAVSGSHDKTLRVWDLESGACLRTLEGHALVNTVSVTPDGRHAVSGSYDKTLRVWDLESGACPHTLEGHKFSVDSVSVTTDGRRAVSGSADRTLRVWDLESGACLRTLEGHSAGCRVSVTPDGRHAVSGSADKTLRVWDLESGACLRTLEGHSGAVIGLSLTPNGRGAVSASYDNTLRVWDLESGACLRTLEGHTAVVWSVSVTPDGRRAVSASADRTLRVWDLESGACLRTLEGHSYEVTSVSVTPDGRHAVSGSEDKTLRVWDLESGTCLRTLEGHSAAVWSMSVTPDGRRAVSGSYDNTLRVWDLESGACLGVFVTTAPVCAVAIFLGLLTIGTFAGQVLFVEMRNLGRRASEHAGYQ